MSCIITYKGKKYSEEQFKEYFINNKQEFATSIAKNKDVIDSFKRKMKGIDYVFSQSPELTNDIQGFKKFVQGKPKSVKPGVEELFESNPELANAVYSKLSTNSGISAENLLSLLEKDNIVEKDCTGGGKLKAEKGLVTSFTKGSNWEIVKDLKGYPSHAQGGVDIKLGKNGFSFTRDNGVIEAKHGLVLPKIK